MSDLPTDAIEGCLGYVDDHLSSSYAGSAKEQLSNLVADIQRLQKFRELAQALAKHGNTYRMESSTDDEDWLELGEKFEDAINDFYEYEATGKIT